MTPLALFDPPITLDQAVYAQSTGSIWTLLVDGDGVPFSPLLLTSLTLTLYTLRSSGLAQVINGRNNQNVLNANGVTLYTPIQLVNGKPSNIRWDFTALDTTLVDDAAIFSRYLARLRWQWPGGIGSQTWALIVQRATPAVSNVSDGIDNYFAGAGFGSMGIGG